MEITFNFELDFLCSYTVSSIIATNFMQRIIFFSSQANFIYKMCLAILSADREPIEIFSNLSDLL